MRIAVVTAAYHAGADDPFVPVWRDMVTALAAAADVTVVPLRRPAAGPAFALDGAAVVPLGHGMVRLRRSPRLWRSAVAAVAARHRAKPYDAVVAFQAGEAGFVAALAAARIGRPLHVHVAGGELVCHRALGYGSDCHWIERIQVAVALRRAALVTTGTGAMAARAARRLPPAARGRVHLAPLGIDTGRWLALEPRRLDDDRPRILAVSDLRPIKDHGTLLRAFARLNAIRPAELDLVGAGETLAATRALALRLGVADRIHLWGWVPPVTVHVPFQLAHAFVHASRHEAQGVALIEAACAGLPIAATAVGVADRLPAASLAPPADPEALARATAEALAAARGPTAGRWPDRAATAAEFDRERCADRWLRLLAGLSAERGPR